MTYSPWTDAGERHPDIDIRRTRCRPLRGAWVPEERMVIIDESLLRADRNSTLAHEIAHIDLGHRPSGIPWLDRRQENDADALAARRLIAIEDLAGMLCWALGPDELADELGVTQRMVLVRVKGLTPEERQIIDAQVESVDWGAA